MKKNRTRGFARVIEKQLEPFNTGDDFRDLYEIKDTKILLNPIDGKYAAFIILENGVITVEGIANKPEENLKKKKLGWNALLETNVETFLGIASGKITTLQMVKKVMTRKIKMKGAKILLDLTKILTYLEEKSKVKEAPLEKTKRARGFARVIERILEPFNTDDEFKDLYDIKDTKILLNAIDGKYAALITLENGTVSVEGIVNTPEENLEKKKLGWNALLETNVETFFEIATGKITTLQMVKKVMSRKIKVKGARILLDLNKLFAYLEDKSKEEIEISEEIRRAKGFARIIEKMLEPFNSDTKFRDLYEIKDTRILLNPTDGMFAALITFENNTVSVEGILNKPEEDLKKKKLGWNALLQTNTTTLLDLATGKISTLQIVKKVMSRKVKMKGARILMDLIKILTYLGESKD